MIVTLSREYGAAGLGVARAAARRLGYDLVDEEIPRLVAERLGTSAEAVEAYESHRSMGARFLLDWSAANPEFHQADPAATDEFEADCRREIEVAVREFALQGDSVIVGRIANMILGARPDVVRVFVHAPLEWRVTHMMDVLGVDRRRSRAEIDRVDEARRVAAREYYGMTWGDLHYYDLTIDSSRFGIEGSGEAIAEAVLRAHMPA